MKTLRLEIVNRGDGMGIKLTSSPRGKRSTKNQAEEATREMLQKALDGLDTAKYEGSTEDAEHQIRRDSFLVSG